MGDLCIGAGHLIIKDEDWAFARPSLAQKKLRNLELRAGMPSRKGRKGSAAGHNLSEIRERELAISQQAEIQYRRLVADWQAVGRARKGQIVAKT